jgi:hypothetical protein
VNKACPTDIVGLFIGFYGPRKRRPHLHELIDEVLIPLFGLVNNVTFIVDGLDECNPDEIELVVREFRKFLVSPSTRLFISCREEIDLLRRIPGSIRIRITPDDTKQDMELFVNSEVDRMNFRRPISDNPAMIHLFKQELLKKADRM